MEQEKAAEIQRDLKVLETQEKNLRYGSFGSAEALKLGNAIAKLALEYDREVSIQIIRESDHLVLFQYVMDSKSERNIDFMIRKCNVVRKSEHSSLWAYTAGRLASSEEDPYEDRTVYCLSGGAFPIWTDDGLTAIVAVSGLHEGKDHELVVRGLEQVLGKMVPTYTGLAV